MWTMCIWLVACGDPDRSAQSPPTSPTGPTEVEMVANMEEHYTLATTAHDALVRGQLDQMRRALSGLASTPIPRDTPYVWRPLHAQLRAAAVKGADSRDAVSGGLHLGQVAATCQACHSTLRRGPIYPVESVGEPPLMEFHQWASEQLWHGVTGPSEYAWRKGVEALERSEIYQDKGETIRSLRNADATSRSTAYGALLSTCADCHIRLRVDFESG